MNAIDYWYQKYITLKAKMDEMMEEAVEGTVCGNGDYIWVSGDVPSQFKYGDKVRIISVKEEGL